MPVIINEFEVINDDAAQSDAGQTATAQAQPTPDDIRADPPRRLSLARRLRMLRERRARVHAD
jgi:hypothetical protein